MLKVEKSLKETKELEAKKADIAMSLCAFLEENLQKIEECHE